MNSLNKLSSIPQVAEKPVLTSVPAGAAFAKRPVSIEPLWTVTETAKFFRASRSWVYHRAEVGLLPCLRIGGLLRFSPTAMRALAIGGTP